MTLCRMPIHDFVHSVVISYFISFRICCLAAGSSERNFVRNPEASKHNYALHNISAFPAGDLTICAWVNLSVIPARGSSFGLFSAAAEEEGVKAFAVKLVSPSSSSATNRLKVTIHYYDDDTPIIKTDSAETIEIGVWSFICAVFKYREAVGVYFKWTLSVHLMTAETYGQNLWEWREELTFNTSVSPNRAATTAALVIFNERGPNAGFDDKRGIAGTITCLNIWSEAMDVEEILLLADCERDGDVASINPADTSVYGDVYGGKLAFPFNEKDETSIGRVEIGEAKSGLFRVFSDKKKVMAINTCCLLLPMASLSVFFNVCQDLLVILSTIASQIRFATSIV